MTLEERIEAAEEPSRDLDVEIAKAVGAKHGAIESVDLESRSVYYIDECALSYTASIDAAMTLVPEGMGIALHKQWVADVDGPVWWARIFAGGTPDDPARVCESRYDAPTPALALCAAALRAREAGDDQ